jgi:hypothetical protein
MKEISDQHARALLALEEAQKQWRSMLAIKSIVIGIISLASGYYTLLGVLAVIPDDGWAVRAGALIFSVSVTAMSFMMWEFLATSIPMLRGWKKLRAWLIALMWALAVICISSWLNAAGLAGAAAQEKLMAKRLETVELALNEAYLEMQNRMSIQTDIEAESARWHTLARNEKERGVISGFRGDGPMVSILEQSVEPLDNIAALLGERHIRLENAYARGQEALVHMRELVINKGPIGQRLDAFSKSDQTLSGAIADMYAQNPNELMQRQAASIENIVLPGSLAYRPGYQPLVDNVNASLGRVQGRLVSATANAPALPPATPLRVENVTIAILMAWQHFVPQIVAAVLIDILPMLAIMILSLVYAQLQLDRKQSLVRQHYRARPGSREKGRDWDIVLVKED